MAVTINDIAEQLGLSPSTVSRALTGRGRVSPGTRERVIETAKKLGYPVDRPNVHGGQDSVAIVFHKRLRSLVADPFYGAVIAGIESELSRQRYVPYFLSVDYGVDGRALFKDRPLPAGVIFIGSDIQRPLVDGIRKHGVPVILVDNEFAKNGEYIDAVVIDNVMGAKEAVSHLISLGHRRIGYLGGPRQAPSLREREIGFREAMRQAGIDVDETLVVFDEDPNRFGSPAGVSLAEKVLLNPNPPTAIFTDNDAVAFGAITTAQRLGFAVPDQLSVVGFDDISLSSYASPPLTTVRVPKEQMGAMAASRLLDMIVRKNKTPVKIVCTTRLVVRQSTKLPS